MKISVIVGIALFAVLPLYGSIDPKRNCCKLPEAKVIKERLADFGLEYFDEKTRFTENFAGREITIVGFVVALETAWQKYEANFKGSPENHAEVILASTHMNLSLFLSDLVKDCPQDFLLQLIEMGVVKSRKNQSQQQS